MNESVDSRSADVPGLGDALRGLPLCDELFLGMQALNLDLVDDYLAQEEDRLLREYMEGDRTPLPQALFVSALSQMWVFAVYEFLRTWRQQANDLLAWTKALEALTNDQQRQAVVADKKREIEARSVESGDAEARWEVYEKAQDPEFAVAIRNATDRTEVAFRRVEAVRMTLAKHEIPRRRGAYAAAPGHGRIEMLTGSIYWQVALGDDEFDMVSRRELADGCRALARPNDRILPVQVQERLAAVPLEGYGLKRVVVTLEDGTEHGGVCVAWTKEVISVQGFDTMPFDVTQVVEVRHDPWPPAEPEADGPF